MVTENEIMDTSVDPMRRCMATPKEALRGDLPAVPMEAWLAICPEPCEDECLESFVARWFRLTGRRRAGVFAQALTGSSSRKIWGTSALSNAIGLAEGMRRHMQPTHLDLSLERMTLAPYYFYGREAVAQPSYVTKPTSRSWRTPHAYSMFPGSVTPVTCIECCREDDAAYGFSWWRRAHQIRGVSVCHKHNTVLIKGCKGCGSWGARSKPHYLPSFDCRCTAFDPDPVRDESWSSSPLAYRFACVAAQMLQDEQPLPLEVVRNALRAEVLSRYGGCDRPSLNRLAQDLIEAYGPAYVVRGQGHQGTAVRRWLSRLLLEQAPVTFIERYVVLVSYLYGSLGSLRQATEGSIECSVAESRPASAEGDIGAVHAEDYPADFPPLSAISAPKPNQLSPAIALLCATLVTTKLHPRQRASVPTLQRLYADGASQKAIAKITKISNGTAINILGSVGDGRRSRRLAKFYQRRDKYRWDAESSIAQGKYFQNGEIKWLRQHDGIWLAKFLNHNEAAMRQIRNRRHKPRRGREENDRAKDELWSHRIRLEIEALKDAQVMDCKRVTPGYAARRIPLKNAQELLGVGARLPMTREILLAACESKKAYLFRRFVWFLVRLWRPGEPVPRGALRRHCLLSGNEMDEFLWLAGLEPDF